MCCKRIDFFRSDSMNRNGGKRIDDKIRDRISFLSVSRRIILLRLVRKIRM